MGRGATPGGEALPGRAAADAAIAGPAPAGAGRAAGGEPGAARGWTGAAIGTFGRAGAAPRTPTDDGATGPPGTRWACAPGGAGGGRGSGEGPAPAGRVGIPEAGAGAGDPCGASLAAPVAPAPRASCAAIPVDGVAAAGAADCSGAAGVDAASPDDDGFPGSRGCSGSPTLASYRMTRPRQARYRESSHGNHTLRLRGRLDNRNLA